MKDRDLFTSLNDLDENIIEEAEKEKPMRTGAGVLRILLPAAALLLVAALVVGGALLFRKQNAPVLPPDDAASSGEASETPTNDGKDVVAATVYFDVNPSVGIDVDGFDKVHALAGVNDDGKELLLGKELVGMKIEDAIKDLLALSYQKGYLTPEQNALLLSVRSDDATLAHILSARLSLAASALLDTLLPDGRVIAQTIDFEERYRELNETENVSPGKAKYIFDILDLSDEYSADDLIKMSFTELLSIAERLGHPVGNRIKLTESVAVAITRFKEVYFPDAEIREDYIPTEIPGAPDGTVPKIHVLYVTPAKGEELCFEIMACRGSSSAEGENWALDTINLKKDDAVYQYAIDPENGRLFYEKVLRSILREEEALDLSISFCGKTKDALIESEVIDAEDQFLIYLLFKNENGYDARNVLVSKEIRSAVSCWKISANLWETYVRRLINDDLHKTYPDKDVKDTASVIGFCDMRMWGGKLYVRCLSDFDGGWHHAIVDCLNGTVVYSEISDSETPSAGFEEQVKFYRDLAKEVEKELIDEDCTPTD